MRQTKKIAVSAMLSALGAALLSFGAFIEVADLTICAVASLLVVMVYVELGSPYTWLVWLTTSLSTALLFPGSLVWAEYLLVFGVWPILKSYFEKLPRVFWLPLKLVFINALIWVLFFIAEFLLMVPFFEGESLLLKAGFYLLINVTFIVYDKFVTIMTRLYFLKYRERFKRFFK
jgi:hypothetical protein